MDYQKEINTAFDLAYEQRGGESVEEIKRCIDIFQDLIANIPSWAKADVSYLKMASDRRIARAKEVPNAD